MPEATTSFLSRSFASSFNHPFLFTNQVVVVVVVSIGGGGILLYTVSSGVDACRTLYYTYLYVLKGTARAFRLNARYNFGVQATCFLLILLSAYN